MSSTTSAIKSVKFKDERTMSFDFAGQRIHRDTLTPELYLKLVGINPKFSEIFEVTFNKQPKSSNNGREDKEGIGSGDRGTPESGSESKDI